MYYKLLFAAVWKTFHSFGYTHYGLESGAFAGHIQKAYQTRWVVHSEPSMADAEHVIRYLGQYTHRLAITNQRILNITDTHVRFIAKDYRDRAQKKPVRMEAVEFLRRFCMHVMPKRFVRKSHASAPRQVICPLYCFQCFLKSLCHPENSSKNKQNRR